MTHAHGLRGLAQEGDWYTGPTASGGVIVATAAVFMLALAKARGRFLRPGDVKGLW